MKFYSELTTELYDSIEELDAAECEHKRQVAELENAKRAQEERKAEVDEAIKRASDLIQDYIRDYGYFSHNGYTVNNSLFWPFW